MIGMLDAVAMAYLDPHTLARFQAEVAVAHRCPACGGDPVLVVRHGVPSVYTAHPPECRERPQLTLIEGGA
jgi:hypothetical protein